MTKRTRNISDTFLVFIMMFACVSEFMAFDIHLSNMPEMGRDLHTTKFMVQMVFVLSLCESWIVALFWGQVSDAYGRRKIALIGMMFALIGQLGCVFAPTIWTLLFFRSLQYLFVGGMWAGLIGVLVEKFQDKEKLAKVFSFLDLLYPVTIMIAPIVGAYLGKYIGWRGNFAFLFVVQVIATFLIYLYLPETILKKSKLTFKVALINYKEIITNKTFMFLNIILCLIYVPIMIFTAHSPYLYIEYFKFSPQKFSIFQAIPMFVSLVSTLLYVRIIKKLHLNSAIKYGIYATLLFCVACVSLVTGLFSVSATGLAILIGLVCFANAFIRPSMETQFYSIFKEKSASVGAVNQASFALIVVPITTLCAHTFDGTPDSVLWWMIVPVVVTLVLCWKRFV